MASLRFETLQLHGGWENDVHNACSVPIYTSASFNFPTAVEGQKILEGEKPGYVYSRVHNPTTDTFERRMAALEGGRKAVACASGAAAIMHVALTLCKQGDNFVSTQGLYSGTYHQFHSLLPSLGIEVRFAKSSKTEDIAVQMDERTKFIYTESIGNPSSQIIDLEAVSELAHSKGCVVVVDNTFGGGGYYIRPIDFSVDIVLHSATKWIGGHGTTIGSIIIDAGRFDWAKHKDRYPRLNNDREGTKEMNHARLHGADAFAMCLKFEALRDLGACMSPTSAQQFMIGLESLSLRCERQAANSLALAKWLQSHPMCAWVSYLGLENHRYYEMGKKYLRKGVAGSVFCFGVRGGTRNSLLFMDSLKLTLQAANVGDSKTLIINQWASTANGLTEEERAECGLTEDLLRVSVGIEHIDDIKDDFEKAFAVVRATEAAEAKIKSAVLESCDEAVLKSSQVEIVQVPAVAV